MQLRTVAWNYGSQKWR